jgi:hypothetical protein
MDNYTAAIPYGVLSPRIPACTDHRAQELRRLSASWQVWGPEYNSDSSGGPVMFGSGDDLAVVLFLFSLGMTGVYTLITIHGWKHKALIVPMWALSVLMIIAALGWPWIKSASPREISEFVAELATHPLTYSAFALLLATILAITRKSSPVTGRNHITVPTKGWYLGRDAVRKFVDSKFLHERVKATDACNRIKRKLSSNELRVSQLSNPRDRTDQELIEAKNLRLEEEKLRIEYASAGVRLHSANYDIQSALADLLRSGKLISRGIIPPLKHESIPQVIPATHWHSLIFKEDFSQASAKTTDFGHTLDYINIEISKP